MNSVEELDSYQSSVLREIPAVKHYKGPANTSFMEIKADSYSTTSANFSISVPQGTLMDKRIWLNFPMRFYTAATDISAGVICTVDKAESASWQKSYNTPHIVIEMAITIVHAVKYAEKLNKRARLIRLLKSGDWWENQKLGEKLRTRASSSWISG